MKQVFSHDEFLQESAGLKKAFLLLHKPQSSGGDCAYTNLASISYLENDSFGIFHADASTVRDIHPKYSINSVPALLIFENGSYANVIKGCNDAGFYRSVAENALVSLMEPSALKTGKSVTVYTTPTCSWCNTLKTFLRKNNITFNEVDVSRDADAAKQMVNKSGQQGVPQTDINGTIVVGFDQTRLKQLLEI